MPVQFRYIIAGLLLMAGNVQEQNCDLIKLCTCLRQNNTVFVRNVIDHYEEWDVSIQDINEYFLRKYLSKNEIAQFKMKAISIKNLSNGVDTNCSKNGFELISYSQAQNLGRQFNVSPKNKGFNDSVLRHYCVAMTQLIIMNDKALVVVTIGMVGRLWSTTYLTLFKYDKAKRMWILQQKVQTATS